MAINTSNDVFNAGVRTLSVHILQSYILQGILEEGSC
jgi:hypothetical protein